MSVSQDILATIHTTWIPDKERNHDETVKLYAIVCLAEMIQKVGWVDHTNDWDLAFEITLVEGQVIAATDIELLLEDGRVYDDATFLENTIAFIRIPREEVAWTQPDDLIDRMDPAKPQTIMLDAIKELTFT